MFDSGTAGTFYVNTGVKSLPGYTVNNPGNGEDFRVDAKVVETAFTLKPEGANLYLELPADTPFPYVPSEAGFANPKYRITSLSKNEIVLVQDLEGISWQYIIAPKAEADVTTTGFKFDYEHNLWKTAEVRVASTWFADANWGELPNQPSVEVTETKGLRFHTPAEMGNDQWQGQVHVETNIEVHSGVTYDFSCNVNVPKAGAVTVKVQKLGDDNTYFIADPTDVEANGVTVKLQKGDSLGEDTKTDDESYIVLDRVNVEAGTTYLYYFKGKQGIDTKNLQLCMDYAGAPGKANITVSGIKMQVAK